MLLQITEDLVINLEHCVKIERRVVGGEQRVTFTFSDGISSKTVDDSGWGVWARASACVASPPIEAGAPRVGRARRVQRRK